MKASDEYHIWIEAEIGDAVAELLRSRGRVGLPEVEPVGNDRNGTAEAERAGQPAFVIVQHVERRGPVQHPAIPER